MTRRAALATPALCTAIALSLAGLDGLRAQSAPQAYQATALESEAIREYTANHLITARARAQSVLDRDPDSITGNYVMGCVLREAEGILPRAMFYLGHARQVYEQRYGTQFQPGAPWQLHRDILYATEELAGEMEEYRFQLEILDYHDALYDPDLLGEHAWPLLHLGRYDEARNFAHRAIDSGDPDESSLGRNALCAIESEAHQRQASYAACLDALRDAEQHAAHDAPNPNHDPSLGTPVAVHAYNAAHAAYAVLRFDEVERLGLEGTHRQEFTIANPWRLLARLYTDEGRVTEAVGAIREMQQWRLRQPAALRDQDRAETDVALATLLLAAGEADAGLTLVDRALERPDRRGLTSSRPDQALGAHALLRRELLDLRAERIAEEASWSGTPARVRAAFTALGPRLRAWPDDQRIASVLADEDRLDATFRFYQAGGIEPLPAWMVGDLVTVLGAGVVAVALEDVRREERAFPQMAPYYDALGADVALVQGDNARALALARHALGTLPQAEAILSARVAAIGAEAARRDGDNASALSLFERALQRDPGVIRRMGLALPATVRASGGGAIGAVTDHAAELLRRSPRLRPADGAGFVVAVDPGPRDGGVLVTLYSPQGATLSRADVPRPRGIDDDAFARTIAEAFHREAFAMRMSLTTADLRSLDGSTGVADQAQRAQMQGLLNQLAQDPDAPPGANPPPPLPPPAH